MTNTAETQQHIFEMVLSTEPTTVLLSPPAAASIRQQLSPQEREVFDASLTEFDYEKASHEH
jgi:hypothetical protein